MTDVRVGDLVKATGKKQPERTVTLRVAYVSDNWVEDSEFSIERDEYDIEVLDRPAPPIDEELLDAAILAYKEAFNESEGGSGYVLDGSIRRDLWVERLTPVINTVREYDNNKENAK